MNFTQNIQNGDALSIKFITRHVSISNSILATDSLTINLFGEAYSDFTNTLSQLRNYSKVGMIVGLSTALCTSVINLDPVSFFNFLNSAEIFTYVLVYQVDINPVLSAFLGETQVNSMIPNPFNYLIDSRDGVQLTGKINTFGNNTNLILLNSGVNLGILALLILSSFVIYCLRKFRKNWHQKTMKRVRVYFKYGVFSRLWLQTCLEVSFNSAIGIIFTNLSNTVQLLDFSFCCIMIVIST